MCSGNEECRKGGQFDHQQSYIISLLNIKKYVLRAVLNWSIVSNALILSGMLFHNSGADDWNDLAP